jgi:hypothetical protein
VWSWPQKKKKTHKGLITKCAWPWSLIEPDVEGINCCKTLCVWFYFNLAVFCPITVNLVFEWFYFNLAVFCSNHCMFVSSSDWYSSKKWHGKMLFHIILLTFALIASAFTVCLFMFNFFYWWIVHFELYIINKFFI